MFATPRPSVRKHLSGLALAFLGCALAGCGNTAANATRIANTNLEAEGSPFRWRSQSVSGGYVVNLKMLDLPEGPTKADAILKTDTLKAVARQEAAANRPAPQLESVKHLKDGREVWVLKSSDEKGVAYVVTFAPTPAIGGVDIKLQGPTLYSR